MRKKGKTKRLDRQFKRARSLVPYLEVVVTAAERGSAMWAPRKRAEGVEAEFHTKIPPSAIVFKDGPPKLQAARVLMPVFDVIHDS